MDVGFDVGFGIPTEGTIGKIKMDAVLLKKGLPYSCYLFTLGYGIGGNKGGFDYRISFDHLC